MTPIVRSTVGRPKTKVLGPVGDLQTLDTPEHHAPVQASHQVRILDFLLSPFHRTQRAQICWEARHMRVATANCMFAVRHTVTQLGSRLTKLLRRSIQIFVQVAAAMFSLHNSSVTGLCRKHSSISAFCPPMKHPCCHVNPPPPSWAKSTQTTDVGKSTTSSL